MDNYVVIYNDGNLKLKDFINECYKEKWIPILIIRDKRGMITVPIFNNAEIAHKCMKRNIPRNIQSGIVKIIDEDILKMKRNGWNIEVMNFPRKFTNHPDYTLDFEIYEFTGETDYKKYYSI